jgi:hypothetical protein
MFKAAPYPAVVAVSSASFGVQQSIEHMLEPFAD